MGEKHSSIKGKNGKIEYSVRITLCVILCIFFAISVLGNVFAHHSSGLNFAIIVIVTTALLWFISVFTEKTANAYKSWLICIFLAAFASRLIMICVWPVEPTSDFKSMYDTAVALAGADPTEIRIIMKSSFDYYYSVWPVHMPFILIETAIIKVFGEGYYAIQIFFAIFSSLSCVMAAMIAKILYGRRVGIIAGIIMAFLPSCLVYSSVLSNQHMAVFFLLTAIYILIEKPIKRRLVNVAIASICTVLAQLMRPEMFVFIIAVICYFIYKYRLGVKNKRKLKSVRKKIAGYSVMFLGVYISLMFIVSLSISAGGFVEKNVSSAGYKYKVATGLNVQSEGRWNEADSQVANDTVALGKLIKERSANIPGVGVLMTKKIMHQYGTYNYSWCIEGKTGNFIQKWYEPITNGSMLIILLLCIFKTIMSIFNKSRREFLLLATTLGYFVVYMIIEVQNRYNYLVIPLFVILASSAIVHLYGYVQTYIEKSKKQKEIA